MTTNQQDQGVGACPTGTAAFVPSGSSPSGLDRRLQSTSGTFEREDRYIVFKKSHLSGEQLAKVERLITEGRLSSSSHDWPLPTVECVIVESDWPEYEPVWAMIQERIAGEQTDAEVS